MKYRKLNKLGLEVSALGFGTMRLPVINNDQNQIDESEAIKMIRHAIDSGVNYVDSAYPYHGGNSELLVGKALKDGYREKTYIATKLPPWLCKEYADFDRLLDEQLLKLQTDHIDFYLLHCMNSTYWPKLKNLDILKWCKEKKKQDKINYIGFSVHDTFPVFKDILDSFDWDFCQIQYNYLNEEVQVGTKGLEYAYKKNIPLMVMEPLLGGSLAKLPEAIEELWLSSTDKTQVEAALHWLWDKKEVGVVLSGMSSMEQTVQNISYASKSGIGSLSRADKGFISKIQQEFKKMSLIPCTKCQYCIDCPKKINIPHIFGLYNEAMIHSKDAKITSSTHNSIMYQQIKTEHNASACVKCGKCEKLCPQKIAITDWLEKIHAVFT